MPAAASSFVLIPRLLDRRPAQRVGVARALVWGIAAVLWYALYRLNRATG
jgi:hypothetical protein